jgi:HlyD family secretion protein
MKKRMLIVLALIAVAAIGFVVFRILPGRKAADSAGYETVAARRDTILATVNASGTVMPRQQATLIFSAGGVMTEMKVKVGDRVLAGQPLAQVDTRQLQASVSQARASLNSSAARLAQTKAGAGAADIAAAEAAVASAQALYDSSKSKLGLRGDQLTIAEVDLKRAEIALREAQAAYDRVASRPEIGMLPQAGALERATLDYQRALSNYRLQVAAVDDTALKSAASQLAQARAQLDTLRGSPTPEDLSIAEAQVEQSQAALDQAQLRLADAVLTAPFSGTVLSISARVGDLVGAATPVLILGNLESYHVDTTIDETDIGRVDLGQDATIALDAFPDVQIPGKVSRMDMVGKTVQGVVSYGVEVELSSTDVPIRSAMTAIADIVVERKQGVLVVPNRAVKRDSRGRFYVEILSGGKLEQRSVATGLSNELVTEILSGLDEGTEVVVASPRVNLLAQASGSSPFGFGTGGSGR